MSIPRGLIVSCQVEDGSRFTVGDMTSFAVEAVRGGCVGVRVRGCQSVSDVKRSVDVPVIGLSKGVYDDGSVWITPSFEDAMNLWDSGSDYIAIDATGRSGYNHIRELYKKGVQLIGDISNLDQAKTAIDSGCCSLTTALSGYTKDCVLSDEPDYDLLEKLVSTGVPILAEGRYWERSQIKRAFDLGAHAVVVGSAITRPHLITERLSIL